MINFIKSFIIVLLFLNIGTAWAAKNKKAKDNKKNKIDLNIKDPYTAATVFSQYLTGLSNSIDKPNLEKMVQFSRRKNMLTKSSLLLSSKLSLEQLNDIILKLSHSKSSSDHK